MKMPVPCSTELKTYLRSKRLEAGLSQRELGRLLGYKSQFVANWERGASSPPAHIMRKLADVLGLPEDELLGILYEESMRYWKKMLARPVRRLTSKKRSGS